MTLKQLEYFLEIAKMGCITKAAQNLYISQPPLSLQLKALEDELGVTLFTRNKRNMDITPEGEKLLERAKLILSLARETVENIKSEKNERFTTIRIGTIGSVNNRDLPAAIANFQRDYPYVNFQVLEGTTEAIMEYMDDNKIDFGFVREPYNNTNLRSIAMESPFLGVNEQDFFVTVALANFYDDFYLGEDQKTISVKSLKGKPIVNHRRYRDIIVRACSKEGFTPDIICENNEIQSSVSWAKAGIGMAITPFTSVCHINDPELVIRRIEEITYSPRRCLVWNPEFRLTKEAKAFISYI